jgi:2-amino-4-hydroxy-6-hydroxymethyldihydropteridine diphosphokinase
MIHAAIGLGSNLGDRLFNLRTAVIALKGLGEVERVSSLYETAPVGGPEQGPFLNAVVLLATSLPAEDLLAGLLAVEEKGGRVRTVTWGPRTLDLDLIVYDDVRLDLPQLTLPHPRAHQRRFVAEPLAEVWPEARLKGGQAVDLVGELAGQDARRLATAWAGEELELVGSGRVWVAVQFSLLAVWGVVLAVTGVSPVPGWPLWVGGALAAAGGFMAGWGVIALGPAMSILPEPAPHAGLVANGPYRLVRHPIYGGVILSLMGVAVALQSLAAGVFAVALIGFFLAKATVEERYLRLVHAGYGDYMKKVRRRLFPGIA